MGKVFITGIGAISSLGLNVQENLVALRSGKTGIGKAKHFQSKYTENLYFAEIDSSDEALKVSCDATQENEFTRTTLIALTAFSEAIKDANLSNTEISSASTAFISSSTVGGMCYTDNLYTDANLTAEPSNFVSSPLAIAFLSPRQKRWIVYSLL